MELTTEQAINQAIRWYQEGNTTKAQSLLIQVLEQDPKNVPSLNLLGIILQSQALFTEAKKLLNAAHQLAPQEPNILNNLGLVYSNLGQQDHALKCYQQALKLQPKHSESFINIASILHQQCEYQNAIDLLEQALQIDPNNVHAHSNLGAIYTDIEQFTRAIAHLEKAINIDASNANALTNLGDILLRNGQFESALTYLDQAITNDPKLAIAYFNRSVAYLSLGQFKAGWADYHWRLHSLPPVSREKLLSPIEGRLSLTHVPPLRSLQDKSVLLLSEQGIGDELFFLRFLPKLKAFTNKLYFKPSPKLAPIIKRSQLCQFIAPDQDPLPATDMTFFLGELPRLTEMNTIEQIQPSLRLAHLPCVEHDIEARLSHLPKPWIGLTWEAGNLEHHVNKKKSAPLESLINLLQQIPGSIIALQYKAKAHDIGLLQQKLQGRFLNADFIHDDLEQALGLLDELDDYVCVSNTNMHLNAMLGRSSQVLIPIYPDFRWMSNPSYSPWFPKNTLYRQHPSGDWGIPLAQLQKYLKLKYS